jgi:hypothetical protein
LTKIILKNTTSAIFLTIVLVAGTFVAISPSFMIVANAQQYGMDQKYNSYEPDYGMDRYDDKQSYEKDNSYDKSKDSVTVKKVKCNNINVNVNGDINIGPSQALGALATEAQGADEGANRANSVGSDGGRPSGSESDSRFVCIDNNDNVVVEKESNLIVNKVVSCQAGDMRADSFNACREFNTRAANAQPIVTPADFIITVTGNNPNPAQFEGSSIPIIVNLGFGDYQVSETADPSVATEITNLEQSLAVDITQSIIFSGDCNSVTGEGTIAEGDLQVCSIENVFTATDLPPG